MSKIIIPTIQKLKLSDLIVDPALSGRNQKDLTANAKALLPSIQAAGGWDATQPGQFFERNGAKHLAAGFTRTLACQLAEFGEGYFVEVKDDPAALRTAAIRTNMGKPISAYEQGRIYVAMRDGDDATKMEVGAVALEAMEIKDIAAQVGYTRQHVENSIAVYESSPEIGELILAGKVAPGIVVRSRQLVKEPAKQLRFLKAAIKNAEAEGKTTATAKHLEAVRADFAPLKASQNAPAAPAASPGAPAAPAAPAQPQPSLGDLGTPSAGAPSPTNSRAELETELTALVMAWAKKEKIALDEKGCASLVKSLAERELPI